MASNFPPGHPTGVRHGEQSEIYYCDNCNMLFEEDQLSVGTRCPNKNCSLVVGRAECETCGEPATRIDTEEDVNAHLAFCDKHGFGG